jgi:hypothetical protein
MPGGREVKMRYLIDMMKENLSYINLRNKVIENGMEEQFGNKIKVEIKEVADRFAKATIVV